MVDGVGLDWANGFSGGVIGRIGGGFVSVDGSGRLIGRRGLAKTGFVSCSFIRWIVCFLSAPAPGRWRSRFAKSKKWFCCG